MKNAVGLLLLLIVVSSSCKQKEGDVLADIKKHSEEINKHLKDYKTKHADDLTTTESGAMTGYYRDDEVRKIDAEHFGKADRTFSEYYFDDGMLILIVKQEYAYNRPMNYTEDNARENNDSEWYDDKKTKLEIDRFYFNKNKLIKWTNGNNKDITVSAENFTNKESELWAETLILIKELKEQ